MPRHSSRKIDINQVINMSWVFILFTSIVPYHVVEGQHDNKDSCPVGTWGPTCNYTCDNCHQNVCDRKTGNCSQCKPGYFTETCNETCLCLSQNGERSCDRYSGGCLDRCENGIYGEFCNKECGKGCGGNGACYPDGICTSDTCKKEWQGKKCNCSVDACLKCTNGCKPYSASCSQRCRDDCEGCNFNEMGGIKEYQQNSGTSSIDYSRKLFLLLIVIYFMECLRKALPAFIS